MALSDTQQFQASLKNSKYILLLFNPKDSGDALSSALALKLLLERQHKQADIASSDFITPKNLSFLPNAHTAKPHLAQLQKFIIKVDVSKNPIETISYDIKNGLLSIYLTPKQGLISKNELRTAQSTFKYDLIITLNTPDLESLGSIFFNNTDLFYRTSIVNIDHQPNNERYGQINILDLTATSTSEVVYRLIKQFNENDLDAAVSTALLTGMTVATKSFKSPNITPFTLQIASDLINRGAEREKIIQHLYRTRSIATLKLWGEALTHLQSDPSCGLVWTAITGDNFARSGGTIDDVKGIIDELISNSPEAKVILLLYESSGGSKKISGIVATEKNYDASHLVKPLNPEGNKRLASFTVENKSLTEAEEEIVKLIKGSLVSAI